ncbi:class I SAM-dependent methyltransferase [Nonomuraea longispora]|uniref:Class I SAM-dependent methyltransferase n=1 Tax=Nonomuraea longispora TaxID=1848320 RepID=A0A4R4MXL4_9ACTN|nr:methyltransferase domain-containing protein [Nonomuraea longispora]TDB99189.1 class I SAM-dependent methyltransferase [Nonomuraea longispora]
MDAEELAARWRERLESWAIPEAILAKAPVDPWGHSPERFVTRTDRALAEPDDGPTMTRLAEALSGMGSGMGSGKGSGKGTLLDVGAGSGAASLPLHERIGHLYAVDTSAAMLEALETRADKLGVPVTTITGRWPDVADDVPVADVAIAAHVVYNVPDLAGFLRALDRRTQGRVVLELPHRHPMSWLTPLWQHFHGVDRPVRPVAEDCVALAAALGYPVRVEEREAPLERFTSLEELAASACRRICLDPSMAEEVAATVLELGMWPMPRDRWTTIWWE